MFWRSALTFYVLCLCHHLFHWCLLLYPQISLIALCYIILQWYHRHPQFLPHHARDRAYRDGARVGLFNRQSK